MWYRVPPMREMITPMGPPGEVVPGHVSHSFWPFTHNRLGSPPQSKAYVPSEGASIQPVATAATFCSFTTEDVASAAQVNAASCVQFGPQPGSAGSGLQHSG